MRSARLFSHGQKARRRRRDVAGLEAPAHRLLLFEPAVDEHNPLPAVVHQDVPQQ